jgi:hypothetical protein
MTMLTIEKVANVAGLGFGDIKDRIAPLDAMKRSLGEFVNQYRGEGPLSAYSIFDALDKEAP